ncbi:hypothetical protein FSW04_19780 [Baekduia soli]|uniref:Uncharacterized protein n=1 Tax=Baekduia soli TaxID=496014 RepID=A0A5B8U9V5_9ACTN|nr:hypothetical protein [Baekduia soli]QEC49588.1 hypothetical protein FSW04_19780 [Baekduia soli]
MAGVIEWGKLGQLLWVAPVAGLAVALTFSLIIVGVSRAGEARRDRAGGIAAAYSALALAATAGFCAVVVYGVQIITTK